MADTSPDAVLRVGLCQLASEEWRADDNLERTLQGLRDAQAQGAELAITPECMLNGYPRPREYADYAQRLAAAAEPLDGPRLRRVRDQAAALGIDVVFGFEERAGDGRIHNSAAYIGRDGGLVHVYRKVHCRPFESIDHDGRFTPGDSFHVARRSWGGRSFGIGTMICFDREIPESARCLRALDAELIACPLATGTQRIGQWHDRADNESITRTRAAENECFIAVVNHAGPLFHGGSFVVGPLGQVECQLAAEVEVRVVEVAVGQAARIRANRSWMGWGYRRAEVYAKYLAATVRQR